MTVGSIDVGPQQFTPADNSITAGHTRLHDCVCAGAPVKAVKTPTNTPVSTHLVRVAFMLSLTVPGRKG